MPGIRTRRMIGANICTSEKVNLLSWPAALIYTWMIPRLCDDEGRMDGSPTTIKACVVPLRDITVAAVADYIKEMVDQKLITAYEVDGKKYISVIKYDDHQTFHGVKKIASTIPPPPKNTAQGGHSTHPGANKVNKGSKVNEEKKSPEVACATQKGKDRVAELTKGLKNIGRKMEA